MGSIFEGDIEIVVHAAPEDLIETYFGVKFGEISTVVGETPSGETFKLGKEDLVAAIKEIGCWGVADQESTIHVWVSPECDFLELVRLLGHERGHLFAPQIEDAIEEENKADRYSDASTFAYKVATSIMASAKTGQEGE